MKMSAVDFFCGCGGVTHGMLKAGIKVLAGLDNNPDVQYAYEKNNKDAKFYLTDIHDKDKTLDTIKTIINDSNRHPPIFTACAPCQPFSLNNKQYKNGKDHRKSLMIKFVDIVSALPKNLRPSFIMAENVGAMKKRGEKVLNITVNRLRKLGYDILLPKIINAADFGVPQNRRRLVFLAGKKGHIKNRERFNWGYFFNKYKTSPVAVREVIAHLPAITAGNKTNKTDPLHITRSLSSLNLKRIKQISSDGGTRTMWQKNYNLKCYKSHSGHSDVYGRMFWDKPAPTLTCRCISISNGRFGHPVQHRAISLREAAILQTMENYEFKEPIVLTKVATQIGNAVPPELARRIGLFIKEVT